jgi:CHASE2 domain-containing sensor protein
MYGEGAFAGDEGLAVWARTVLWVIPASVVASIVVTILFNIVFSIATQDEDPDTTVDERDRSISIKGMRVTMVVASAGFIGALAMLALGWSPLIGLNVILAGFALGDLSGSVTRMALYRS